MWTKLTMELKGKRRKGPITTRLEQPQAAMPFWWRHHIDSSGFFPNWLIPCLHEATNLIYHKWVTDEITQNILILVTFSLIFWFTISICLFLSLSLIFWYTNLYLSQVRILPMYIKNYFSTRMCQKWIRFWYHRKLKLHLSLGIVQWKHKVGYLGYLNFSNLAGTYWNKSGLHYW